jgi:hypothetical protein
VTIATKLGTAVSPLVVPFAAGFSPELIQGGGQGAVSKDAAAGNKYPEIYSLEFDFEAAYADMGRKAARYLRGLSGKNPDARCGIVFQENFMRSRKALDAFVSAFKAEMGGNRLDVEELSGYKPSMDPSGEAQAAIAKLAGDDEAQRPAAVLALAIDDAFIAESAASDGLARSRQNLAKTGKATVFLADESAWGKNKPARGLFRYRIEADGVRLAKAAAETARAAASGKRPAAITKVALRYGPAFPRIF